MRESWTDGRMDDLSQRVDQGFDQLRAEMNRGFERVDTDIRDLRAEMNRGFERVDEEMRQGFERVDEEMGQGFKRADENVHGLHTEMNMRFDSLQRTMILAAAGVIASLVGLVATQL